MTLAGNQTVRFRARGPLACFTRPELKVERVSYPVITPSAARGLLEAVLWKPAITWRIHRIQVLTPVQFTSFRRNEVNTKAVAPAAVVVRDGGEMKHYFADDDRAQRNTVALRDVDYLIEADFVMTAKAGERDNPTKFLEMFSRRLEKGQHYHQPYFGCREFIAEVMPSESALTPIAISMDLGWMLWDIDYAPKRNTPLFFDAKLVNGVLDVPLNPPGRAQAMRQEGAR